MSLMFFLLYRIFAVKSISESGNAQYAFFGTKGSFGWRSGKVGGWKISERMEQ